ncbi:pancreatic triacylglycerol lipase [Nilaparvata lugens]|uniref:Pancreatic lipase n=1 Tax=Nilaparvata lugens TaxID=108931 RepID=A0A1S5VG83_NILLU|nr:pancreatic triacylglycerol lipase [Nilaparvata lugens]AQN78652.1 pancreatic lipase [Nilaparvata lugens]
MRDILNTTGNVFLQTILYLTNTNFTADNRIDHASLMSTADEVLQNSLYNVEKGVDVAVKCYDNLGCYSINPPWTDVSRPVSKYPEPPEKVSPKYCLYTRHNRHVCQQLVYTNPRTIYRSYLMPTHKVYFIAHGFLENGEKDWIKNLTSELLERYDVNVISVDWGNGSSPPYTQAVANIRLVGTITAHLIHTMSTLVGLKAEFCHVIGHSLGAHLAGYVGSTLQTKFRQKLGRITGLDPAEPHFSKTDPIVRLDPTDANYVDIIHSDATPFIRGGLGMDEPIGHLDFYPNGGENQPGCDKGLMNYVQMEQNSFFKGVRKFLGCDHVRSLQFFNESVNTQCKFIAIECDTWENFIAGECFECSENRICASMGMNSFHTVQRETAGSGVMDSAFSRNLVKLYTITGPQPPFCRDLYRIAVSISSSEESLEHDGEVGQFRIELEGEDGSRTEPLPVFKEQYFKPGEVSRTVVAGSGVGRVVSAVLHWTHQMFWLLSLRFQTPKVYLGHVEVDYIVDLKVYSVKLCPDKEEILSGRSIKLHAC